MVASPIRPASVAELREAVVSAETLRIEGAGLRAAFRLPSTRPEAPILSLSALEGIVEFSPQDQVVTVLAGTRWADLQGSLAQQGHWIPYAPFWNPEASAGETVGGLLALDLPNAWAGRFGSWRDWLLGAAAVLADGSCVRSGSKVVKSVAGYDLHRLWVGSRGTLAVLTEATFRTWPLAAAPDLSPWEPSSKGPLDDLGRVEFRRTSPSRAGDYRVRLDERKGALAPDSATVAWELGPPEPSGPDEWVVRSGAGDRNLDPFAPATAKQMARIKAQFDPDLKFNPGEMGIF